MRWQETSSSLSAASNSSRTGSNSPLSSAKEVSASEKKKRDYEEQHLNCVDRGLDVFGESVKKVIYWRFTSIFHAERSDILRKPELFSECLRNFFGTRAFRVEESIVASIVEHFRPADLEYSDSLTRAIRSVRRMNWE